MQKKEDALKGVKLFVFDMDGTVYLGNHMIDGAGLHTRGRCF